MCHLWILNARTGGWDYKGTATSSETFLRMQDARFAGQGTQFFVMKV